MDPPLSELHIVLDASSTALLPQKGHTLTYLLLSNNHLERIIIRPIIFGRPFVKRFALCDRSVVLSVTFVHCGQTVGRIKMKLSMQVGFGQLPLHQMDAAPNFRPMFIVAKRLDGLRWHLAWR